MKTKITIFTFFLCSVFLFLPFTSYAAGASLYFSPSSKSYKVGKNFTVSIFVSSKDQAMNAAQGSLIFPTDKLKVVSVSKSGTIIDLWTQEPSFSNSAGTVNFEGIVLNPGFKGSSGKIISITFNAKAVGDAVVSFASGSVLANDGQGTGILTNFGNGRFNIESEKKAPPAPVSTTPSTSAKVPLAPMIYSSTHSDPNKWYNNKNPKFSWSLSEDINGVSFLIDDDPSAKPGSVSDGLISEKEFENIEDGAHYFHLCFKNIKAWGAISHFMFNIDTEAPTGFTTEFPFQKEIFEQGLKIKFTVDDDLSKISHFSVKIDNQDALSFPDNELRMYDLPILDPGKHTIIAEVFDNAGNSTTDFKEIEIKALNPPIIKEYSEELIAGSFLVIKGNTYPNADITIWVQKDKEIPVDHKIKSDDKGDFLFISDSKISDGRYKLWAEAITELGFKTEKSKEIFILTQQSDLEKLKHTIKNLMVIVSVAVTLLLLLFLVAIYGIGRIKLLRSRLRKEVGEVEQEFHKAFNLLKKDIQNQVKLLEKLKIKRKLTKADSVAINKLKQDLDIAEKLVQKEIKDVKDEIK